MLDSLIRTLDAYKMLARGDAVVAAVSGGADSVALLHGLLALRERFCLALSAAHVNHNLRGAESLADEGFSRGLCARLGVPLRVFSADTLPYAKEKKLSVEEAARLLRYGCLFDCAKETRANTLAVAHNQNDQAETVLLNIARGAGPHGLRGMPPTRAEGGVSIIRPLIETPRGVIEAYLRENNIEWRTDASNGDPRFARNRVRSEVLPALERVNPRAVGNIASAAALLAEDDEFLRSLADDAFLTCTVAEQPRLGRIAGAADNALLSCTVAEQPRLGRIAGAADKALLSCTVGAPAEKSIRLDIPALLSYHPAIQKRVVRRALAKIAEGDGSPFHTPRGISREPLQHDMQTTSPAPFHTPRGISREHVERVLGLLRAESGRGVELPRGLRARREHARLFLYREGGEPAPFCYALPLNTPVFVPELRKTLLARAYVDFLRENTEGLYTIFLRCDRINGELSIRSRLPGDRIALAGVGAKKLKDYFIDRKVPLSERGAVPLLACGSDILFILGEGGRAAEGCAAEPDEGEPDEGKPDKGALAVSVF
jgi:tRNA(Ile)-lysidine synthase